MLRPLVLLSNDDGYRAPGIQTLRQALFEVADVVICAPEVEQSAASHSLSLHRPLRLLDHGDGIFSVDGTPADSVYVGLYADTRVVPRRPDLVISGVNWGPNLGEDVFYSGTVAAAREGALRGLPSLAVSAAAGACLTRAAEVSTRLAIATLRVAAGPVLLNVNFPPGDDWPIRVTCTGRRVYTDGVEFRTDPRGREYLWLGSPGAEHPSVSGSDTAAFDAGMVSITPLALDLSSEQHRSVAEAVVGASDEVFPPA
jgi:5'-nucleotidase